MASTYSTNLGIEMIGGGEQSGTWGTTTNNNFSNIVEQAISGYGSAVVSTGSTTIVTIPNGASGTARNMVINVTGTGGASTYLEVPNKAKLYIIFNAASGAFTVKPTSGSGVSVPASTKAILYCDGTNVVDAVNYLSSLSLGAALPVASGGTGLATLTANNVILGNGTSTPSFVAPGTSGNLLTSNGTTWTSAAAPTSFVAGMLMPYAGSSAPSGWLMCYGQAVSRTVTYSALFAAIGTSYGSGDGSTTFNIPDLRGRVPAGKDDMGGSAASRLTSAISGVDGATLGASGGDQRQQSHTHTATDSGHTHTYTSVSSAGGAGNIQGGGGSPSAPNTGTGFANITVASTGAGSSQNVQPTLIFNYIIKY